MATAAPEQVMARVRKLLALAGDGSSEAESLSAMAQVHRLLAAHNLSLEAVQAGAADPAPARAIDETQFDPAVDRWTVPLWHATADLFFCR